MRRFAIVAVAAAALAAAPAASAHGVGPAGISVHAAPFDLQFIDQIALHHQMQLEMAQLALRRGQHAELKALARRIIAEQRKDLSDLRKLRGDWYGSATFQRWPMDQMMMRMMGMGPNMMKGLERSGRFDYAWLSAVIAHHSAANTMARWETQEGEKLVLRKMAKKMIASQAQQIGEMMSMRKRWYG